MANARELTKDEQAMVCEFFARYDAVLDFKQTCEYVMSLVHEKESYVGE